MKNNNRELAFRQHLSCWKKDGSINIQCHLLKVSFSLSLVQTSLTAKTITLAVKNILQYQILKKSELLGVRKGDIAKDGHHGEQKTSLPAYDVV